MESSILPILSLKNNIQLCYFLGGIPSKSTTYRCSNWFENYVREKKNTRNLVPLLSSFFLGEGRAKSSIFQSILFIPQQLLERPANQKVCEGPGPDSVLSSKCDSSPDRGIIGNRWLTLLICGLKLQTEFQESSRVINGNRKSHTQPNQYVVVVG